jgi:lipopolysaccharide/colanic/teichoic acid biosynthesis glycosyltransferase
MKYPPKPSVSSSAGRTNRRSWRSFGDDREAAATPVRNDISRFFEKTIRALIRSETGIAPDVDRPAKRHFRSVNGVAQDDQLSFGWDNRENALADQASFPCWKRILDIACILLTLPCWLPLMLVVAVGIKIASPGPSFYRQERVGYRKNRFMIFKFRTMHINSETRTHEEYFEHLMRADCPMKKLDAQGDFRLIVCGRFLRASGLDELPQIFNVLRGEMSLVGPRPCLPHEFQRYEMWQQQRCDAVPGLTGYWQVNGKNNTTFSEMIAMDIFYARNLSVWLDLKIMLKTVPTLIRQTLESRKRACRQAIQQTANASELNEAATKT